MPLKQLSLYRRYQPVWPTFITLNRNVTSLHHLSTQHFLSPKALVNDVTEGNCVFLCACAYVRVSPCVQAGIVTQVVFELMANRCAFACPYVSTRSYIRHLSQYDANLTLLS